MDRVFDVRQLSINQFTYELPDERIAVYPLSNRDDSKLLLWNNGEISDHLFRELPERLPTDSLLVFNNTRVIRARLFFQKATGAQIEIFCLEPHDPADYVLSFGQTGRCIWKCIVGNAKKWKGETLIHELGEGETKVTFGAKMVERTESNAFLIEFSWNNPLVTFADLLERFGNIPIPPYLHRESEESDLSTYQTVYSKIKGSVAAPTAGLHFTERIFDGLRNRGIACDEVTLHVGAGTFQPVKSDTIGEHPMHTEHFVVSKTFIERLANETRRVIAVGTTSVRTLESLYRIGCKLIQNDLLPIAEWTVSQWEAYNEMEHLPGMNESFRALSDAMNKHQLEELSGATQIIILPGYRFGVISGMVTNFHQPQSTLLLLIAAFLGDDWQRIYDHALSQNYRFLSYGDSNLYLKS